MELHFLSMYLSAKNGKASHEIIAVLVALRELREGEGVVERTHAG